MDKEKISKNKGSKTIAKNSKFFKTIIKSIDDKKGENIVSIDLRNIPEAVADYFIICSATNTTQLRAIADYIEDDVKNDCEIYAYKHEGRQHQNWIIIDYVSIVVHIMMPDARKFYRLEEMWSDGSISKHE